MLIIPVLKSGWTSFLSQNLKWGSWRCSPSWWSMCTSTMQTNIFLLWDTEISTSHFTRTADWDQHSKWSRHFKVESRTCLSICWTILGLIWKRKIHKLITTKINCSFFIASIQLWIIMALLIPRDCLIAVSSFKVGNLETWALTPSHCWYSRSNTSIAFSRASTDLSSAVGALWGLWDWIHKGLEQTNWFC